MIRNFLIKILFSIPAWIIELFFLFRKDIKRNYIFDSQSRMFLFLAPKFDIHLVEDEEIPYIRNLINERRKNLRLSSKTKKIVISKDHEIDKNLRIREYIPYVTDNDNVILYFHGGGYVLNSIDTHHQTISYFSEKLRTRIFSLAYSLSPEKKFPCAKNEALRAINWLIENDIPKKNISLCGDSAGAHLAASVTHTLANNNEDNVDSQFLIYPMCDPNSNSESIELFQKDYLLTKDAMKWFWDKLRNKQSDDKDDTFNLLLFKPNKQFPKTIIVTAGFDPLSDEAEKYAYLLHESGTFVKQLHYPTLFHGFAAMSRLKSANKAVIDFLSEYKKIL